MKTSKQSQVTHLVDRWFAVRSRKQLIEMIVKQYNVSAAHASSMYQTAKTRIKKDTLADLAAKSYVDERGYTRWSSNDSIPPMEILTKAGFSEDQLAFNKAQSDIDTTATLEEYAKNENEFWSNPENEDEQRERLSEMRAAFGKGGSCVNVFTGQRHSL